MIKDSTLGAGGILLAALLGLVACGDSASTAAGGAPAAQGGAGRPTIDPCSLVTRAEAETAMGEPATGAGRAQGSECKYTGQANDGADSVSLTLGTPDGLKKVVTGNGVGGTVTTEPMSGLGDEAVYAPGLQVLFVRTGSQAFLIQLATVASVMNAHAGAKDADVTLARAALGRLGAAPASASSFQATTSASTSSVQTTTSAAPSSQSTAVDACSLVTQQEASAALGVAAGPADTSGCSYKGPTGETVSVIVIPGGGKQGFDAGRAHVQGAPGYQDVPGVGDGAFMGSSGGGGQFYCLKGSTILTITLSLGRDGQVADALMTLGKTACGRM